MGNGRYQIRAEVLTPCDVGSIAERNQSQTDGLVAERVASLGSARPSPRMETYTQFGLKKPAAENRTRLGAGFSVVHVAMLPVQPGVAEFMGEDIAAAGHGKALADEDGLGFIVPDAVGIGIALVHLCIGKLPDRNPVAKREHYSAWNPGQPFPLFDHGAHEMLRIPVACGLAYHNTIGRISSNVFNIINEL